MEEKEFRQSSQIGTRLARVRNPLQILQSAGKSTLMTASLASVSHPRKPRR
jgi:hypothetical protein